MPGEGLILVEDSLNFLGAFIGFSVAYVSSQGYRETRSPTLLRLTLAFLFLGVSFALSGLLGFVELANLSQVALVGWGLVVAAAALETAGYFFLAFSHVLNVMSGRLRVLPALTTIASVPAVFKAFSLYFLLYGFIETFASYRRIKKTETLLIATGLGFIALAEFVRLVSALYPSDQILLVASLIVKIIGFLALFVPVLRFSLKEG